MKVKTYMINFKYLLISIALIPGNLYAASNNFVSQTQILSGSQTNSQNNIYNSIPSDNYSTRYNNTFWEYLQILILTLGPDISNLEVLRQYLVPNPEGVIPAQEFYAARAFDSLLKQLNATEVKATLKLSDSEQENIEGKELSFKKVFSSIFASYWRCNNYKPQKITDVSVLSALKVILSSIPNDSINPNEVTTLYAQFFNIAQSLLFNLGNISKGSTNSSKKLPTDLYVSVFFQERNNAQSFRLNYNNIIKGLLGNLMLHHALSSKEISYIEKPEGTNKIALYQSNLFDGNCQVKIGSQILSLAYCTNYTMERLKHNIVSEVDNFLKLMHMIVYSAICLNTNDQNLKAIYSSLLNNVKRSLGDGIFEKLSWGIYDNFSKNTYTTAGNYLKKSLIPQIERFISGISSHRFYNNNFNFANMQVNANIFNTSFGRNLMNAKPLAHSNGFEQENNKKGENILIDLNNNTSCDIKHFDLKSFLCSQQEVSKGEAFTICASMNNCKSNFNEKNQAPKGANFTIGNEKKREKKDNKEKLKVKKNSNFSNHAEDESSASDGPNYIKDMVDYALKDYESKDYESDDFE